MKEEAVIYARVSSSKQISEGHGNKSQIQACNQYAELREWKVIKSFEEPGISGATTKRPEMEKMITFLKKRHAQGKETFLIVDDLKRFSRDIGGYIQLKEIMNSCGAELRSPKFNFEDSPEGEFIELMTVLSGQLERKQNRRQVIDRMTSRLEMGYWPFPATPPGYKLVREPGHGKIMRRSEPEASIYTEALEGYAIGRFPTPVSIKAFLDMKLNKSFYIQHIRDTLDRSFIYAGYIEYPKWEVTRRKGNHDALISLETCLQIQDRLHNNTRKNVRKDINPDFPLRGYVHCEGCGKTLRSSWCTGRSKKYPKYWCSNKSCEYYSLTIDRKIVEGDFEKILILLKPEERTLQAVKLRMLHRWEKRMNDVVNYQKSIANEIRTITAQINELVDRIPSTTNRTVATAYEKRIEELELQRTALQEKEKNFTPDNFDYRTALDKVIKFIENPYERWKSGILSEQLCVLDICFTQNVKYHPKEGYRTIHISPTFTALTNSIGVLESTHKVQLQGCGHGRN